MENYKSLRKINENFNYLELGEMIGTEVLIDVSSPNMINNIQVLLESNLNLEIERPSKTEYKDRFRKLGILDLDFILKTEINYPKTSGFNSLEKNAWLDRGEPNMNFEVNATSLLNRVNEELEEGINYLKLFAQVETKGSWLTEKTYLVRQLIRKKKFELREEDRIQTFKIIDMCITNYKGVWDVKHFYM